MRDFQLNIILNDNIEIFINNIAYELEHSHDHWFEDFGFPIFGQTSKEYHEQVYFESYFESYTRKLINSILKDICDEECAYEIKWPEFEYDGIYNGYTNVECEKEFGFEFIDIDRKIGYRYTRVESEERDSLLKQGNVEKIVCVEWKNEDDLWNLFTELFADLDTAEIRKMYDSFIERVSAAVAKANSMISLVTLPGFTPYYMSKTRHEILSTIKKEMSSLSHYSIMNSDYKKLESTSSNLITKYKLSEHFLNNHYELLLIGLFDYAKSFSTSEYLYKYFKNNPMFDYTPVVSSYLKSIEQLLSFICNNYAMLNCDSTDMSAFTLGKYIKYMNKASNDTIFRPELRQVKGIIYECLNSYRIECRNNLFHKDYFNSWNKVEMIRKNTLFLYVIILGSVNPTLIQYNEGILDLKYDRLFKLLDKKRDQHF